MRKQYHSVARRPPARSRCHSTNQLVMQGDVDVQAGKTGFISKAGYCLATLLRLPQGGPQVAVVVLGAKSNAGRFMGNAPPVQLAVEQGARLLGDRRRQKRAAPAATN